MGVDVRFLVRSGSDHRTPAIGGSGAISRPLKLAACLPFTVYRLLSPLLPSASPAYRLLTPDSRLLPPVCRPVARPSWPWSSSPHGRDARATKGNGPPAFGFPRLPSPAPDSCLLPAVFCFPLLATRHLSLATALTPVSNFDFPVSVLASFEFRVSSFCLSACHSPLATVLECQFRIWMRSLRPAQVFEFRSLCRSSLSIISFSSKSISFADRQRNLHYSPTRVPAAGTKWLPVEGITFAFRPPVSPLPNLGLTGFQG